MCPIRLEKNLKLLKLLEHACSKSRLVLNRILIEHLKSQNDTRKLPSHEDYKQLLKEKKPEKSIEKTLGREKVS
jgi:hypothetical protein